MPHLILLGDSMFGNAAYTSGGPAVINHLQQQLAQGWCATPSAVDGARTDAIDAQLKALAEASLVFAVTEPLYTARSANVVGV